MTQESPVLLVNKFIRSYLLKGRRLTERNTTEVTNVSLLSYWAKTGSKTRVLEENCVFCSHPILVRNSICLSSQHHFEVLDDFVMLQSDTQSQHLARVHWTDKQYPTTKWGYSVQSLEDYFLYTSRHYSFSILWIRKWSYR